MHVSVEHDNALAIGEVLAFLGQLKQVPDGSILQCSIGKKSSGTYWLKADVAGPESVVTP